MNFNTKVPKHLNRQKDTKVHIVIGNKSKEHRANYVDTANKAAQSKVSSFQPRKREANEAGAPYKNIWTDEVYMGEELRPFAGRAGAMDAYALPSSGLST
jgi:hypothetical protein